MDSFRLSQENKCCHEGFIQIIWVSAEIFKFCQFWSEHSTPLTHFNWLGKMSPVMKISYRLVEILLRYLSFCQFWLGGGVHQLNFPRFATFWIVSNWSGSRWPTMANFATEVAWIGSKWPILVNFNFPGFPPKSSSNWLEMANFGQFQLSPGFPQKVAQIDLEWLISPIHNFSNLFPPKWLIFGQISKFFIVGGGELYQTMVMSDLP